MIKNLVNIQAWAVGILAGSGMLGLDVGDGVTTLGGLVIIVTTIWLAILVHKKN